MAESFQNEWDICFCQMAQTNMFFSWFLFWGISNLKFMSKIVQDFYFPQGRLLSPDRNIQVSYEIFSDFICYILFLILFLNFIFEFYLLHKTFGETRLFSSVLLRHDWHKLYTFKVNNIKFWYVYTLQNDYHNQCN